MWRYITDLERPEFFFNRNPNHRERTVENLDILEEISDPGNTVRHVFGDPYVSNMCFASKQEMEVSRAKTQFTPSSLVIQNIYGMVMIPFQNQKKQAGLHSTPPVQYGAQ